MFCSNCGNQLDEGAKFCSKCGKPVGAQGATTVGNGVITFVREKSFAGALSTLAVKIDDGAPIMLSNGQSKQANISDGTHTITASYLHQKSVFEIEYPQTRTVTLIINKANGQIMADGVKLVSAGVSDSAQKLMDQGAALFNKFSAKTSELASAATKVATEQMNKLDSQKSETNTQAPQPKANQPVVKSAAAQVRERFDALERKGMKIYEMGNNSITYIKETGMLVVRYRGNYYRFSLDNLVDYKIDREANYSFLMGESYYRIYFDMSVKKADGTLNFIKFPIGDSYNKQRKCRLVEKGEHIRSYIGTIKRDYKSKIDPEVMDYVLHGAPDEDVEYSSEGLRERIERVRSVLSNAQDKYNEVFEETDLVEDFNNDIAFFMFYLSKADGDITREEVTFIKEILDDEDITEAIVENNYQTAEEKGWFESLPDIFDDLSPDKGFEYYLPKEIYEIFEEVGKELMAADKDTSAREIEVYTKYMHRIFEIMPGYKTSDDDTEENEDTEQEDKESLDSLLEELNNLIGLSTVKDEVNNLINFIQVQKMREERGLNTNQLTMHLIFSGNPGTGKTTVARLLSKIFSEIGLLSEGNLVEVDRAGLVGGYVGQTALKVQEVVESALGGVLFIDEAYSLVSDRGDSDYGKEAIDTLIKGMEDYRNDLVVIAAGYPDKMEEFLDSNPGLRSRFNKVITFEDYTADEMYQIFEKMVADGGFTLDNEAAEAAKKKLIELVDNKDASFANGREVRNIYENIISKQANRVSTLEDPSDDDLCMIVVEDL